jgi:hypothetical protein
MPPMGVGGLEGPLLRQDKKRNDIPISIKLITISAGLDFLNVFFIFYSPKRKFQKEGQVLNPVSPKPYPSCG